MTRTSLDPLGPQDANLAKLERFMAIGGKRLARAIELLAAGKSGWQAAMTLRAEYGCDLSAAAMMLGMAAQVQLAVESTDVERVSAAARQRRIADKAERIADETEDAGALAVASAAIERETRIRQIVAAAEAPTVAVSVHVTPPADGPRDWPGVIRAMCEDADLRALMRAELDRYVEGQGT